MNLLARAKNAIIQKNFAELEDLWTEMILMRETKPADFFELGETLKKAGQSEKAGMLLEMLADYYESEKLLEKALVVRKKMVYFSEQNKELRMRIIELYKMIHKNSPHIQDYLNISGLDNNVPILKAIASLEQFLEYDVGRYFYFERYGFGEVIETIPEKKEIIIDFERKKRHFLSLVVAQGLLTPVLKGSFLHYKYTDIESLKTISQQDPVRLIKMILKDASAPLTSTQIKTLLNGIIEKQQLGKWWEKQRKKIEKDENINVSGRATKQYSYISADQDKTVLELTVFDKANTAEKYFLAENYAQKNPELFQKIAPRLVQLAEQLYEKKPGRALDILMLCKENTVKAEFSFSMESAIDNHALECILEGIQNAGHQKKVLAFVRAQKHDWQNIFKNLMLEVDDPNILSEIASALGNAPNILKDIYYTVISFPQKYPAQYQWMLKLIQAGKLKEYLGPGFVPRMINSIDQVKGIKKMILKILDLDVYDKIIARANPDEAKRILEAVNASMALPDYQKNDFTRIIEFHHPGLFTKPDAIIYATPQALKKKQEEMDHLINVAIPENKKEISRAREYGDLSENFEYKSAREKQDQLYSKLRMIEEELTNVQIIDPEKITVERVTIGSRVIIEKIADGKQNHYTILGRWDTDLSKNIISNEAPVAKSLIDKVLGDSVVINEIDYRIVRIEKAI
jgi:transcription elongation factor GreA